MLFKNRQEAGQKLADKLDHYKGNPDVVVLGLPRGGVVVAYEIAQKLGSPLDILVPRKIGAPYNPEFAIGAITEEGELISDADLIYKYMVPASYIKETVEKEKQEAKRRASVYRHGKPPLELKNKIVIVVDDGIATGHTMKAALHSIRSKFAKKIVLAVPVLPREALEEFSPQVDEFVYIHAPLLFGAVGQFYERFGQTTDEEVMDLLQNS